VLYASGDGSVSDRIVWLGAHKSTRASHPVRLVEFRAGGTTRAFLTSVLDPAKLSVRDIAVAYARRWDIEMAFDLLKRHPEASNTCGF
jgi:IS4 transposase